MGNSLIVLLLNQNKFDSAVFPPVVPVVKGSNGLGASHSYRRKTGTSNAFLYEELADSLCSLF